VTKAPRFATRIQRAVSGRELRILDQPYPTWTWTLSYSLLRDKWDARGQAGSAPATMNCARSPVFFCNNRARFNRFCSTIRPTAPSPGSDRHRQFQRQRLSAGAQHGRLCRAGSPRPDTVSAIYCNGVLQSPAGYTVDANTGLVTFAIPPPAAQSITADFTYRFRVRFADDTAEFENFMYQLWQLKQIKLQSALS